MKWRGWLVILDVQRRLEKRAHYTETGQSPGRASLEMTLVSHTRPERVLLLYIVQSQSSGMMIHDSATRNPRFVPGLRSDVLDDRLVRHEHQISIARLACP